MLQKRLTRRAGWACWLACLLIASAMLSACQPAATSAPIATLTSPVLPAGTPTADLSATSLPSNPAASPTPQVIATAALAATEAGAAVPAGQIVMPILLYHHVSETGPTQYRVAVDAFRAQMELLKKDGYQTVTVSQVADVIRSGGTLPEKPVAITFDDGYLDAYENAYPILRELGFTATVYIITSTLGTDKSYGYLQEDALKELIGAGWEIGSHGVTHTDLRKTKLGVGNEMKQSKEYLETKLGIKVRSFSYPFGIADQSIKDLAAEMGYDSGVGIDVLNTHTANQLFFLTRREVHSSIPLSGFPKLLVPSKQDDLLATQSAMMTQTPTP
jgi:peptidoglycan/xylan/chitin deacetylase (PgdA/CDA1 family)